MGITAVFSGLDFRTADLPIFVVARDVTFAVVGMAISSQLRK
jgi:hypothetical protein